MKSNIIFFNHWHNGDLFTTRPMVVDIINQLESSGLKVYYAHRCDPHCTDDIAPKHPESDAILDSTFCGVKIKEDVNSYYINTWVGAWKEDVWGRNGHKHPSFIEHLDIYESLYSDLRSQFGFPVEFSRDIWKFVPSIDYVKFNIAPVWKFANLHKNIVLISNSKVRSEQSEIGNMSSIIEQLTEKFPDHTFVATEKFETNNSKIHFTSDITNLDSDLCEISYLSSISDILIGKNSSPFTYFQTKKNLLDSKKVFICFSKDVRDVLPHGMDTEAKFIFSNTTEDHYVLDIIERAIRIYSGNN